MKTTTRIEMQMIKDSIGIAQTNEELQRMTKSLERRGLLSRPLTNLILVRSEELLQVKS